MFKPNTVLVLGAAASFSDKLLGNALKSRIQQLLRFQKNGSGGLTLQGEQYRLYNDLRSVLQVNDDEFYKVARMIVRGVGLMPSIDSYLDIRRDHPLIARMAKIAIGFIIHELERQCDGLGGGDKQSVPDEIAFNNHWYQEFAQICFDGVERDHLDAALRRFSVVSFNYDRCFEKFIRIAIERLYDVTAAEATLAAKNVWVRHPYGHLGDLPGSGGTSEVGFGVPNSFDAKSMAERIKTYSEGAVSGGVQDAIRTKIESAGNIVFLGFGYHSQNVNLLTPTNNRTQKTIIGTAFQTHDISMAAIKQQLERAFAASQRVGPNVAPVVELFDVNCTQLLAQNRRSLIE
jgi:hypothetical protein